MMPLSPQISLLLRSTVFLAAAIPITTIDQRSRRIPDALSLGGLAALAAFDILTSAPGFPASAAAGIFAFLLFWMIRRLTKGLGLGDVKYAGLLGFFAGPKLLPLAFFVAAASGLAYALVALKLHKRSKDERVAFGPFLSIGGLAAAVWMILRAYGSM